MEIIGNAQMVPTSSGAMTDQAETFSACIPNISPRERRKRLMAGGVQLGIGAVTLAALVARGADRWWRLPLFLLFGGAASGFFQWRDKT